MSSWQTKRETLRRDGFVRLGQLVERDAALALGDNLASHVDQARPAENPYGVLVLSMWQEEPRCAALVQAQRIDRIARQLLDVPEVILFQDLLIWKQANNTSELKWHQDYSYWPLQPIDGVVVWIALDDVTIANGCLHYVRGTHLGGELRPTPFAEGLTLPPALAALDPIDFARAADEAEAISVRAGEAIAHDTLVWHMSPVNTTDRPRRAWASMWTRGDARWDLHHASHPYTHTLLPTHGDLVRGARFPVFTESIFPPPPTRDS